MVRIQKYKLEFRIRTQHESLSCKSVVVFAAMNDAKASLVILGAIAVESVETRSLRCRSVLPNGYDFSREMRSTQFTVCIDRLRPSPFCSPENGSNAFSESSKVSIRQEEGWGI